MKEYQSIGKSIPRIDSVSKVTGRTRFISDLSRPGMLRAKLLLSDRPHAKITKIDLKEAEKIPGVKAVITSADAPGRRYGLYLRDRNIFAIDRVRYIGEPIAAVAAVDIETAEKAIGKIKIEFEDLEPIFTFEDALDNDLPLIHPEINAYSGIHDYIKYGNICMDANIDLGDPEQAFQGADLVITETYQTHGAHHVPIEPHACLAEIGDDGRVIVWTGTQQLSVCHSQIAQALDIPMTEVRIVPAWIGGGFGGKLKASFEPIAALLAQKSKAPVKLALTTEEEFITAKPRAPFRITIKSGVMRDGKILSRELVLLADAGAYADHVIGTATHSLAISQGPYNIPNCYARARAVYTNNRDWGCMRGYGAPQITFAVESHMDSLAAALEIDPADFRLMNLAQEGDPLITTQPFRAVRIKETMEKALDQSGYYDKRDNLSQGMGFGIANSLVMTGLLSSSAIVKINEDATVTVLTAVTDIGTGTHTVLIQIVSEVLGIPFGMISIANQDSDTSPYDTGSIASRTTYDSGNAVRIAAEDLREKLIQLAADHTGCEPTLISWENGQANIEGRPENSLSIQDLMGLALYVRHGPLIGEGSWLAAAPWNETIGEGYGESPYGTFMYGTHVVETELEPETGKISILKYTACHDVGKAINPIGIEGQIEGGVVQGLGFALSEEMIIDQGRVVNPYFSTYLIPTSLDVPPLYSIIDQNEDPTGPFGAKGIGEPPIIPPAAAIGNALFDMTGIRFYTTPINPEKVFYEIKRQKEDKPDS